MIRGVGAMFRLFKNDPLREQARETLRHARHVRRMREDLLASDLAADWRGRERALETALQGTHTDARETALRAMQDLVVAHTPRRTWPGLRENLEILVVAIGVAMACRTYFIQPFKIPTGSMQPTLYGIQYVPTAGPTIMDRMPLKVLKWIVYGAWYTEVRVREAGYAVPSTTQNDLNEGKVSVTVARRRYQIPRDTAPHLPLGAFVGRGQVLWKGVRVAGDHVFVDRVRWNITRPRRGQIMVFNTDGIETLPPKTHYIKRMAGLPGERVGISPPHLVINDVVVREPASIARVESAQNGYAGYQLMDSRTDGDRSAPGLRRPDDRFALGPQQYFALGDNTMNSRDGRYWGAVPRQNLVGPAVFVYWPISSRWGLAR